MLRRNGPFMICLLQITLATIMCLSRYVAWKLLFVWKLEKLRPRISWFLIYFSIHIALVKGTACHLPCIAGRRYFLYSLACLKSQWKLIGHICGLPLKYACCESISPGTENLILAFLLRHNPFFFFLNWMRKLRSREASSVRKIYSSNWR